MWPSSDIGSLHSAAIARAREGFLDHAFLSLRTCLHICRQNEPVSEDTRSDRANVVGRYECSTGNERRGLRRLHEPKSGARATAKRHARVLARERGERDRVGKKVVLDVDARAKFLERYQRR